jgi:hypothetical protein
MTQSIVSPFNSQSTRTTGSAMRCLYAHFLQNLYSFNNNALFIKGVRANKSQLVPMIADARQQLEGQLQDAITRKQWGFAERTAENLRDLENKTRGLCLMKDVAYEIAGRTPTKG